MTTNTSAQDTRCHDSNQHPQMLALCHRVTMDSVALWCVPVRTPTAHRCPNREGRGWPDTYSRKCRRLRIVSNLSQNSKSSLFETLDKRNCGLRLRYLSYSFRTSTKIEHGDDSPSFYISQGSKQVSSTWSITRSENIPSSQRLSEKGEEKMDSNLFLFDSRRLNLITFRKLMLDGQKSFASTQTNWQEKTTHTLPHRRKDRGTQKHGP